jgi:hypothetical protein
MPKPLPPLPPPPALPPLPKKRRRSRTYIEAGANKVVWRPVNPAASCGKRTNPRWPLGTKEMRRALREFREESAPYNRRRIIHLANRKGLLLPSKGGRQNLCALTYELEQLPAGTMSTDFRLPTRYVLVKESVYRPERKRVLKCRGTNYQCGGACIKKVRKCRINYSSAKGRYLLPGEL